MDIEEVELPTSKPCTRCGKDKPLKNFYKQWSGKYGRTSMCRHCLLKAHKIKLQNKKLAESEKKKCSTCKRIKSVKDFYLHSRGGGYRASDCKLCASEKSTIRYYKRIGKRRPRKVKDD